MERLQPCRPRERPRRREGAGRGRLVQPPGAAGQNAGTAQRRNGPALRDTLLWFGLLISFAVAAFLLWGSYWAILPFLAYGIIYGSSSDSRWHEPLHGTAFKTDWLNTALYEVASFMVQRESTPWRWSHMRHHSDTIIVGAIAK